MVQDPNAADEPEPRIFRDPPAPPAASKLPGPVRRLQIWGGLLFFVLALFLLAIGVFLPGATWATTAGFVCLGICAAIGVSFALVGGP